MKEKSKTKSEKKIESDKEILKNIEDLLKETNSYLKLLVDFEETRKRIHPTSEELFSNNRKK